MLSAVRDVRGADAVVDKVEDSAFRAISRRWGLGKGEGVCRRLQGVMGIS